MKNLKIILCLFFSSSLIAEPIDLICVKKFDQEVAEKSWINWDTSIEECKTKDYLSKCKYPVENKKRWEKCKNSEVAFQFKIRFDRKVIENGSGQGENTITQNCAYHKDSKYEIGNNDDGKVILTNIKVTPSYIMFSDNDVWRNPFQVDRKTLIGEEKQKLLTNFVCRIEEIKEKKNLL